METAAATDIDIQAATQLMRLGIMIIAVTLIGGIVALAGMVRCHKNYRLSKTERWLWLIAQMAVVFPAFIYLIVVDKSRGWKAAGAIALLASLAVFLYTVMNPDLMAAVNMAGLPDLQELQGLQ